MRAIKDTLVFATSVAPLLRTTTISGTGVDLANAGGNAVFFQVGALTDGTHTPKLQESSDNSTYTDVAAADQVGTLAALAANTNQKVSYIGSKRYIRAVITVTGSPATGCNCGVVVVTSNLHKQP